MSKAGMDMVLAVDANESAVAVYNANMVGHEAIVADLSSCSSGASPTWMSGAVDLLVGGPPCQDFSIAMAEKRVEGKRANLTLTFGQITAAVRPMWFVMENVPEARKSVVFRKVKELLSASYGLTECVLDASFYGVPQKRKRLFLVGRLGGKDGELTQALEGRRTDMPCTLRDHFGDRLPQFYYRHPRHFDRRGLFSIDEPSPTIRGTNRPIPKDYFKKPDVPHPAGYEEWAGGWIPGPGLRHLTIAERAEIQGFPQDFNMCGKSASMLNEFVGNAVPVGLAKHVGKVILDF